MIYNKLELLADYADKACAAMETAVQDLKDAEGYEHEPLDEAWDSLWRAVKGTFDMTPKDRPKVKETHDTMGGDWFRSEVECGESRIEVGAFDRVLHIDSRSRNMNVCFSMSHDDALRLADAIAETVVRQRAHLRRQAEAAK